jgi:Mg2+-importing ATPase
VRRAAIHHILSVLDVRTAATRAVDDVLHALDSSAHGLRQEVVDDRLRQVGPNLLATRRVTASGVLVRQLRNPLLILLLAAAAVSAGTGSATEGLIICAIVGLSVVLGFVNEYRSETAVAQLHAGIRHETVARRDGHDVRVPVADLVPGDVVSVRTGDIVPADLRVIEASGLQCDEAVLTGESVPVTKSTDAVAAVESSIDVACIAFMGTVVPRS